MTPINSRRRVAFACRLWLAGIASLVGIFAVAVAVQGARASIIAYDFSPDASMTVAGNVIAISGSFDFDTIAAMPTDPDITLGYRGVSETLNEIFSSGCPAPNGSTFFCAADSTNGDAIALAFDQSLALGATDPLLQTSDTGCGCDNLAGVVDLSTAVTGAADPVSVPEPSSLALIAAALAALGIAVGVGRFGSRARRRPT